MLAQSGPLTKLIFPFAAGGSGDMLCRLIAEHLRGGLDRTIIVENRTGADGLIGIKSVMNAAPDGTTILITTGPTMYLLPMVEAKPSFDHARDFVPVSLLSRFEFAVVAGPATGAKGFSALVTWLKANPARSSFGVPSNGTIPHFTGSRLETILGIPMTRVPYRGGAPILKDLVGGHLPFAVVTVADAIAQHRAGAVHVVAISSEQRSPFLPDVQTLKENGVELVAELLVRHVVAGWERAGVCAAIERRRGGDARQARGEGEAACRGPHSGRHNAGAAHRGAFSQYGIVAVDRAGDRL